MAYGDSTAASLVAVRASIAKVLNSQEYRIGAAGGGRQTRYAELKELRDMEKDLVAELAAESGTNPMFLLGVVDLPT